MGEPPTFGLVRAKDESERAAVSTPHKLTHSAIFCGEIVFGEPKSSRDAPVI
jgi:hypothetical protein